MASKRSTCETWIMELASGITVEESVLKAFCEAHGIRRLSLFGSALRGELRSDSDIDLLVEFLPDRGSPGFSASRSSRWSSPSIWDALSICDRRPTSAAISAAMSLRPPGRSVTPPEDLVRLRHLSKAAAKAVEFSRGKTRRSLEDDELLRLGLTKFGFGWGAGMGEEGRNGDRATALTAVSEVLKVFGIVTSLFDVLLEMRLIQDPRRSARLPEVRQPTARRPDGDEPHEEGWPVSRWTPGSGR